MALGLFPASVLLREPRHQMTEPGASGPSPGNSSVLSLRCSGTHALTHSAARKTALEGRLCALARTRGHPPPPTDGYDLGSFSRQELGGGGGGTGAALAQADCLSSLGTLGKSLLISRIRFSHLRNLFIIPKFKILSLKCKSSNELSQHVRGFSPWFHHTRFRMR